MQNEYAYRKLFILVNLCESSINEIEVLNAMDSVCSEHPHKYVGII